MCDHCVKRQRAYDSLPEDEQSAVDEFSAVSERVLTAAATQDRETYELALIEYGDNLDFLLGIMTVSIPDSPASLF